MALAKGLSCERMRSLCLVARLFRSVTESNKTLNNTCIHELGRVA